MLQLSFDCATGVVLSRFTRAFVFELFSCLGDHRSLQQAAPQRQLPVVFPQKCSHAGALCLGQEFKKTGPLSSSSPLSSFYSGIVIAVDVVIVVACSLSSWSAFFSRSRAFRKSGSECEGVAIAEGGFEAQDTGQENKQEIK